MRLTAIFLAFLLSNNLLFSQDYTPCFFDQYTNKKRLVQVEQQIQAAIRRNNTQNSNRTSHDIFMIPIVVHIIHDGGFENISDAQVESQIQILNEDYGKMAGTNGDGNGVDTNVRFCLANKDPNGNCTNGIVRIKSPLANHQTYQRALLKELSFWDNDRYLNIYVVKSINGNVGGYSSFPGGPPDEDGVVVRHNLFGNRGTASSGVGRTTTHELGHWFGLYHTFNNGCGSDLCTDGDYVCDTPPQAAPSFSCATLNTCSNDVPNVSDQKENYLNYTPGTCQNMFTKGQSKRIEATLTTIRRQIWSPSNLISTGCDSGYLAPTACPVVADFVTLTTEICVANTIYFMDRSLNKPMNWNWTFMGGNPARSTDQNPTVTYNSVGTYAVKLVVSDSTGSDSLETNSYITVNLPGRGDPLSFKENFDSGIYPPSTLTINNLDGGITWELDSMASVSGNYSLKINNLINTNYGSSDELILPHFDLGTAHPDSNVYMSFKWAYAKSDPTFSDEMLVLISTDCGLNYSRIFYRTQAGLATGPTQTTPFIPDSTQWKDVFIPLNSYRNSSYVQLKIVNVTDGGNNLYIDNIYVGDGSIATTNVSEISDMSGSVFLYPNPSMDNSTLAFVLDRQGIVKIEIYSMQGQLVKSINESAMSRGNQRVTISTSGFKQGVYFVRLTLGVIEKTIPMVIITPQ
jgi:PKD repeat protein